MTMTTVFRERLRRAVHADPRPQKVIAHQSGYSESYIRRAANPTLAFVDAMATTLGVPSATLLGLDGA